MPLDSRMSRMLHVLIHLDRHIEQATSEQIANMLGTNAVVVRRMMSGLREMGIVASEKGHGGGWRLTRDLADVSLLDIYMAIGEPRLFNIGPHTDNPECLVEQAVDARLGQSLHEAETLLRARFASITVADLATDFEQRFSAYRAKYEKS
ncbi:MAG: Rrf2 family transcriptional regulator [Pseudomonadota bacterium]